MDGNRGSYRTIVLFHDGIVLPSSTTLGKKVIEAMEFEKSGGGGFSIIIPLFEL